jgi:hypothetical protein
VFRFSCVAYRVCLWRRWSFRFARHMTASHIASLLCVANGVCRWRRRSLRFARHMTASLSASLLLRCIPRVPVAPSVLSLRLSHDGVAHCLASLRCKRRVPVAPSVSSLRSSQDGVAHCFASLALQTACACGAVGPFASLVTRRRRSLLRFSCVEYRVCLWRRRSLRFARHKTALLIASLPLRCTGAAGPFASLVV